MAESEQPPRAPRGPAAALARMPTGAKLFLILGFALLPLALIGLFIAVQSTRRADHEARARLQAVADESSPMLASALAGQVTLMRDTVAQLEAGAAREEACARIDALRSSADSAEFRVTDQAGRVLCGGDLAIAGASALRANEVQASLVSSGLVIRLAGAKGVIAKAFYPVPTLRQWARPNGFVPEYGAEIVKGGDHLAIRSLPPGGLSGAEHLRAELGLDGLVLQTSMPRASITSPLIITTVILLLMWVAAAAIAWFVVDVLLIRPLRRLRRSVGDYVPGEVLDIKRVGQMPAQEIRELGDTFREITHTVQTHEAGLAEGLVRQTRLTREVHHRVKNNLQVIASLINFHARAAKSAEATEAYASIQRRVDALAVVHRHHYAEMEENRGLELRSVIGELAANIRATAPEHAQGLGITLEIEPLLVNQDVAIAVAFLITEIVELAMNCAPAAQIRVSAKSADEADRAILRVVSPALVESPELETMLETRYGRVLGGLARQLRTKLHYDPLVGAYEAGIAINGRP